MCNSYRIGRKQELAWRSFGPAAQAINEVIREWTSPRLIRPTNPAPVLLPDGARMMRWGFKNSRLNYPLNNTRTDKLDSFVWKKAWTERRRCLIPVDGFFEYTGPTGNKQAHLFHSPTSDAPGEGSYLWLAGIWEPNAEVGDCFSMLMRDAAGIVTEIHDRMPVLLTPDDFDTYLAADTAADLVFPPVDLVVADVANPLKRSAAPEKAAPPPPPPPAQGELF